MRVKEMLKNKKLLTIIGILIVAVFMVIIIFADKEEKQTKDYDYCYKYVEDQNMVTQTIEIYDKNDDIQSEYYVYYKEELVSYTKANKAVIPIQRLNLKDHQDLKMMFIKDEETETKYNVVYCE